MELSECWRPAVCTLSSRIDAKSANSLPSNWLQIIDPMRSLPAGCMPYSLGITAAARARAVCGNGSEGCQGMWAKGGYCPCVNGDCVYPLTHRIHGPQLEPKALVVDGVVLCRIINVRHLEK